jgi:deoxyribodipyrimidine photolyase
MYRFNVEKVEQLIHDSGLRRSYIIDKLDTSPATFGRWIKGTTPIPLVKAAELADLLNCDIKNLYERTDQNGKPT